MHFKIKNAKCFEIIISKVILKYKVFNIFDKLFILKIALLIGK